MPDEEKPLISLAFEGQMWDTAFRPAASVPETGFALRGGPRDPQKRGALCEDFCFLAQEAEALISVGSSYPTSAASDFVKRLLCAVDDVRKTTPRAKKFPILLTTSVRHIKSLRVNALRLRTARAEHSNALDLDRLAAIANAVEALRDEYFDASAGGEDFSAVLVDADSTIGPAASPRVTSETKRRIRPGPKPNKELASKVANIVDRTAGGTPWRPKLDEICEALDEADLPCPKTWLKGDDALRKPV